MLAVFGVWYVCGAESVESTVGKGLLLIQLVLSTSVMLIMVLMAYPDSNAERFEVCATNQKFVGGVEGFRD